MNNETPIGFRPINPQDVPRGRGNCGLVALAHFTDQPYDRVERFIGKLRPANWKGVTWKKDYLSFFARIGLRVTEGRPEVKKIPLDRWVRLYTEPGVRYMVITTGHAQVVYDGKVIDQRDDVPAPVGMYHFRRKQVRYYFKIEG